MRIDVRCRAIVGVSKDFLQHFRGKPFLDRAVGISVARGVRRFLFSGPGKIRAYSISGISSDFSSAGLKLRKTVFAGHSFRTLLMANNANFDRISRGGAFSVQRECSSFRKCTPLVKSRERCRSSVAS